MGGDDEPKNGMLDSPRYRNHVAGIMSNTPSLKDFRRIVVKVGSSLLVDASAGGLKRDWLAGLAADIAALHKNNFDTGGFSSSIDRNRHRVASLVLGQ